MSDQIDPDVRKMLQEQLRNLRMPRLPHFLTPGYVYIPLHPAPPPVDAFETGEGFGHLDQDSPR